MGSNNQCLLLLSLSVASHVPRLSKQPITHTPYSLHRDHGTKKTTPAAGPLGSSARPARTAKKQARHPLPPASHPRLLRCLQPWTLFPSTSPSPRSSSRRRTRTRCTASRHCARPSASEWAGFGGGKEDGGVFHFDEAPRGRSLCLVVTCDSLLLYDSQACVKCIRSIASHVLACWRAALITSSHPHPLPSSSSSGPPLGTSPAPFSNAWNETSTKKNRYVQLSCRKWWYARCLNFDLCCVSKRGRGRRRNMFRDLSLSERVCV